MGQNISIPRIQSNSSIFDGLTNDEELMIASYNREHPSKQITTMNELPIPNEETCNSIKNAIEFKIQNGKNQFNIVKVECFIMLNSDTLPTLNLNLFITNYKLFDKISEEMNISDLLIELGLNQENDIWYFWQFETIKENVFINNKEVYLYQFYAHQL